MTVATASLVTRRCELQVRVAITDALLFALWGVSIGVDILALRWSSVAVDLQQQLSKVLRKSRLSRSRVALRLAGHGDGGSKMQCRSTSPGNAMCCWRDCFRMPLLFDLRWASCEFELDILAGCCQLRAGWLAVATEMDCTHVRDICGQLCQECASRNRRRYNDVKLAYTAWCKDCSQHTHTHTHKRETERQIFS